MEIICNDLDKYSLLDHTHSNYVTSSTVSTMISNAMSGGNSMIRKITRGTSTASGSNVTISCSITDISKVIVLLDTDCTYGSYTNYDTGGGAAGGGVYLVSISNSNIIVKGQGISTSGYSESQYITKGTVTFSYQIIEFM